MSVATKAVKPEEAVSSAVAAAWRDYLKATRGQTSGDYEQIEPYAFAQLRDRLGRLGVKLKAV